jgi:DNA-binding GntR family transcriptional regulator
MQFAALMTEKLRRSAQVVNRLHTIKEGDTVTLTMDETIRGSDNGHAADEAYRLIREQILTGRRDGGEWLREGELAEAFGVSRTPVREALRRLTAEGLVRYERNRGVQVQVWSVRDLDEIFSLRSVMEPWGCRLAATSGRADLTVLTELTELADAMDRIAPDGRPTDVDRLTELNNRFHGTILQAADNSRLTAVIASVVQVPLVWRTFTRYSPEALRRSLAHHHELVSALADGDPDWAESVMRSHVRAAWSTLRAEPMS